MTYLSTMNPATLPRADRRARRLWSQIIGLQPQATQQLTISATDSLLLANPDQLCADLAQKLGIGRDAVEITTLDYINNLAKVSVRLA